MNVHSIQRASLACVALAISATAQIPGTPPGAPVVINEFRYDTPGSPDLQEFVELYNRTGSAIDISNWTLESTDALSTNFSFPVPPGTSLPAGAYYVFGNGALPVVHQLIPPGSLENSEESLTLRADTGSIIDTLIYEAHRTAAVPWDPSLVEGEGIWSNATSLGTAMSWQRHADGLDTNNNGRDFRHAPMTPGLTNDLPSVLPHTPSLAAPPGTPVPDWAGSLQTPRIIDPTVVSTFNPNSISAPPPGGQAAVFWNESGGGNLAVLQTETISNVAFDGWVYLDATPEASGEYETWSIGIRGSSDPLFAHPDPNPVTPLGITNNGNTGVSWTYQVTDQGARLYLIDHGDGGWGSEAASEPTLITAIPVASSGWYELRLRAIDSTVEGRFGGASGATWRTTSVTTSGGIYIGYNENLTNLASARPPTISWIDIEVLELTIGGSGCQGSCPTVNENVDDDSLAAIDSDDDDEYLFLVKSNDVLDEVHQFCYFMETKSAVESTTLTVRAYPVDDFQPQTIGLTPLVTHTMTVKAGASWWTSSGPSFAPTSEQFWLGLTVDSDVILPIIEDGDVATGWKRSDSTTTAISGNWAIRVICDDDSPDITGEGDGSIGGNFDFNLDDVSMTGSVAAGFLLGFSDPTIPLGGLFGVPWAFLRTSGEFSTLTPLVGGKSTFSLAIPFDPALSGLQIYGQWVLIETSTFDLDVTANLGLVIQ